MRALILIAVLAAGCGGQSDEDAVRETARQLAKDAHAHKWGDFCAATTNPEACQRSLVGVEAAGVDAADYIPDSSLLDNAAVKVDGGRATLNATGGEDAEYVRRDGRWVFVWQGE